MGTLFIVATPIGNLEDITFRALRVLKEVDVILCEDTRQTQKLLIHFQFQKRMISYHQHSSEERTQEIIDMLREGKQVALVSDSGTPGLSDPGGRLVRRVREELGAEVVITPVPGPSALTAAASVAGLPVSDFLFLGFIPHKNGRQTLFRKIGESERTVVFYESPHRILKAMQQLEENCDPDRQVVICRELTKKFETIVAGTLSEVAGKIRSEQPRGEYVVLIEGKR
ncbi:MAG: 16S rRNA (cytidine(1402)-2'-O)-methyltransferase [Candidatus Kerfeldbacteria bacterium RIFCSPLOWO2_01_FULL_48_11]|uniref:Ribosomal RNA small subunit methyltransferase I n=1 Tax=Candidatus Kerfeldbacteria bacterium RIFCSPLOWO2_01_FULL_48_11 TaxID=1798543 RepID=A0A1G2B1T3_9BACT|nr:MAG: Ribosomal RNA small subunit methyltransferase I [Parcubacteria group bacterium GW2011_GWA2_48_9]KKW15628.1 MAG: Ribosomal RNA small subunit methyltransferase I [Parcubacteria group bacterium GW2011_GWC2_49_9]OGY82935.1 MAG: 16S rRNA (cytidine(1402)-2'-O)-methyltransferase [Candidatus Kerfeldbacteria bacterium RIFCSPLOWO2_01_FULL_48_11]HCJ52730.1 16S rRNA (cytidine(1402)-2'-O)-methyltransferase [Candidatus Kerfeldbacteria bacterium]HCM67735.1 16S rRNA (cytidine(1402)-2'-O)-methyltransfer